MSRSIPHDTTPPQQCKPGSLAVPVLRKPPQYLHSKPGAAGFISRSTLHFRWAKAPSTAGIRAKDTPRNTRSATTLGLIDPMPASSARPCVTSPVLRGCLRMHPAIRSDRFRRLEQRIFWPSTDRRAIHTACRGGRSRAILRSKTPLHGSHSRPHQGSSQSSSPLCRSGWPLAAPTFFGFTCPFARLYHWCLSPESPLGTDPTRPAPARRS